MIIDFTCPTINPAVIVFPEWVFPDQPKNPDQLKNTVVLTGTQSSSSASLSGTTDNQE